MSLLFDLFGAVGPALLLTAFWLNVTKRIKSVGAAALAYYALNSTIFLILESIWVEDQ